MNLLITGGCGFVGSNLAIQFKCDFPDWKIIALRNKNRSMIPLARFQICDLKIPNSTGLENRNSQFQIRDSKIKLIESTISLYIY